MGFGSYRYEAATGEQPAPAGVGFDTSWTSFVEEDGHGDVVRFWIPDTPVDDAPATLPVVYEILKPHVDDERARWLIAEMFFVVMTDHAYRGSVRQLAFRRLDGAITTEEPYPDRAAR